MMTHTPFESCMEKQQVVQERFKNHTTNEQKYEAIIELGNGTAPFPKEQLVDENLVKGCQSRMYLHSQLKEGKVYFQVHSDSLISSGLAQLLVLVYDGEAPETILKCPPHHLEALGIHGTLTMNRSNGLSSLHLKMKQVALTHYMTQQSESP